MGSIAVMADVAIGAEHDEPEHDEEPVQLNVAQELMDEVTHVLNLGALPGEEDEDDDDDHLQLVHQLIRSPVGKRTSNTYTQKNQRFIAYLYFNRQVCFFNFYVY